MFPKFYNYFIFLSLIFSILFTNVYCLIKAEAFHDPKHNVTRINLDKKSSIELFKKWQDQALSGLMASIASKKIGTVSKEHAIAHERCAKSADTVIKHAQCVSVLLQQPSIRKHSSPSSKTEKDMKALFAKLKPEQIHQPVDPLNPSNFDSHKMQKQTMSNVANSKRMKKYGKRRKQLKFRKKLQYPFNKSNRRYHSKSYHNLHPKHSSIQHTRTFKKHLHSRFQFRPQPQRYMGAKTIHFNPNHKIHKFHNPYQFYHRQFPNQKTKKESGAFELMARRRKKRYTVHSNLNYTLQNSQMNLTPLGQVAQNLMKTILDLKNKTERVPWQRTMDKARETAAHRKETRRKARLMEQPDPYEAMAFKGLDIGKGDLMDILEDPNDRKDFIKNMKSKRKDPTSKLMGLFRDGMKLTHVLLGKNVSNFDEKTIKLMSPRLFSVTEDDKGEEGEDDDPIDILSPSLLSLHGNGKGLEQELSLPNLVKGFTTADQQQWLDLIFEASGVEETLQKADDALAAEEFQVRKKRSYEEKMRGPDGQPLYFTKEKAIEVLGEDEGKRTELYETLIKSYTSKQLKEISENGYAILNRQQLKLLYGPNSPHKNSKMIENYGNRSEESIHEQIYDEIHQLATNESFQKRQKDIVLSPIIYANFLFVPEETSQPAILSPIMFTNIVGSPITLGPTILGPWGFLPLIASPRTLSPAILTPFFFVPVILSPLTLHPIILSPGIFNPFVLSPLLLAPLILSPQVFTPLVLCPLALSPFILNPTVGSPVILSPFVLTPVIFSPLALFALVLSPNALSPVIQSKLIAAEIVLSPSWLS